ncbi:MAG: phosphoribosylamine--glycine ligase [bacterium]
MNVLIIGAGGREHALAWKCRQSPKITSLHVTPGNGGIESQADCWYLTDHDEILSKAKEEGIQLAIIGQEDYLVEGLTEKLEAAGIAVFGPSQLAARLEGSKVFAKEFMKRHKIPTARFEKFSDVNAAKSYLRKIGAPYVIKASGLAAGKGVLICPDIETAEQGLDDIMVARQFGAAGEQVVIEEFLEGEEASFFIITDGKSHITLPSLQDHKRQHELDQGLNTGGMGCYAPAPIITQSIAQIVNQQVVEPTLRGMAEEGYPYRGVLYIGLMIKDDQPRVVEYNIRFGDPECQPLMMLLDSDLVEIALAVAESRLSDLTVHWKQQAAASVILASGGDPESYGTGFPIQGLEEVVASEQQMVFHAGTKRDQNRYLTAGGRVLGITCIGDNLEEALKKSYRNVARISWPGMQYRRDIGLKGLKRMTAGKKEMQVAIIMGSASDRKIADKATAIFDQFNVSYEVVVSSAHRTPERTRRFIEEAEQRGAEVFIAIAGMAAHLPGVVASETRFPVIGVPVNASTLGGQDALLSIVQMPPGIPVATVGIDRGDNAALLAVQILSIKYPYLKAFHFEYRLQMEQKVIASN